MSWLLFALAAPALWAVSNMIDSRFLEERVADPVALVVVTGVFSGIPGMIVVASGELAWPGLPLAGLAALAGVLSLLVYLPYFEALDRAPTASVLLMWNAAPALIVLLARAFLHEELLVREHVAVLLLVVSSILGGARPPLRRQRWSPAMPWMGLASVLLAVASVAEKRLFELTSFSAGLGWMSLASLAAALALACFSARPHRMLRREVTWMLSGVLVANQCLDVAAATALSRATSLGPVSLVHAVGGVQPLFVLGLGATIGLLRSRQHESLSASDLARSVVAVILAAIGLGLVPLS